MSSPFKTTIRELIHLAWPVIAARAGIVTMTFVDTIMVGHYASQELAYLAISYALVNVLLMASMGFTMGVQIVTAMAFGAGKLEECGAAWRRGLPYAFAFGSLCAVGCLFGVEFLRLTGQNEDLSINGGAIIALGGIGLPFALAYIASASFLEGIKRPLPGMIMIAIANILNIFLNWVLVYGKFGLPEMGAIGSIWATNTIRIILCVVIAVYIWWLRDHANFAIRKPAAGGWRIWKRQRSLGYAAGVAAAIESAGFNALGIMAGWMGALALGVNAIMINIISFVAMVSIGVGTASAVQVGYAVGKKNLPEAKLAGWTGTGLTAFIVGFFCLILWFLPQWVAGLYTTDPNLVSIAVPVIVLCGFLVIFDGIQLALNSILRGYGETWMVTIWNLIIFLGLMLPLCWWLGVDQERGILGLFEGVTIACAAATVVLAFYFYKLTQKPLR